MQRRIASIALVLFGFALAGCAAEKSEPVATTPDEPTITLSAEDAVVTSDEGTHVTLYVTKDGFVPAMVTVPAGKPVTLNVTRKTNRTCATELVMKDQDIDQELPLDQAVAITFTPEKAGELHYACAMDMIKGTIVVE